MTKIQIAEMLCVMCDMTKAALEGVNFVEISTYLKNHVPGIEPEYIEIFRDMITPIMSRRSNSTMGQLRYNEVTGEFEI